MKNIELNFISRVRLVGILNGANGKNGGMDKIHALLSVYEKVHFVDDELARITVKEVAPGVTNFEVKGSSEFCNKTVEIEDQQAKWLLKELDDWTDNAGISDYAWLDKLKGELRVGTGVNTPSYGHAASGFNPYVGVSQYYGASFTFYDQGGTLHTVKGGVLVS